MPTQFKYEEHVDEILIKCPHCGAEYLPAEIFLPKSFLGQPTDIQKIHNTGKLDYFVGTNMNLHENYVCDFCNTPFNIEAKVSFDTFHDENTFLGNYVTDTTKVELF